jgi:hypothetical protein
MKFFCWMVIEPWLKIAMRFQGGIPMVFYTLQALYGPLYLSQSASPGQIDTTPGTHLAVVSEYGLQQYVCFRGVNYTMSGVGNPGHAYFLEVFGGTGPDALVADVPASSHAPGSPVQAWTQNGGRNQLWTMIPVSTAAGGGGDYYLRNVESGLVLDVPAYSKQSGTEIQQWTLNYGSNQIWIPLAQVAGSLITYQFSVQSLGVDQNGAHLRFTGSHHQPNTQGQIFLINAPGPDYTSTASPWTDVFPIDGNGNFTIDATQFIESGSDTIPQNAVAVLEDGEGYVSAMFQVPQAWLQPS